MVRAGDTLNIHRAVTHPLYLFSRGMMASRCWRCARSLRSPRCGLSRKLKPADKKKRCINLLEVTLQMKGWMAAMIHIDEELDYLAECRERLSDVDAALLAIEAGRAADSLVVSAAPFALDPGKIRDLAHQAEDVLSLIDSRRLLPTPDQVGVLLRATGTLRAVAQNAGASSPADIAETINGLAELCANGATKEAASRAHRGPTHPESQSHLKMLLVEDDFDSRLLLQTFLSSYGECHVAVNGREAVAAFRSALGRGQRYDLICMDIRMPEMGGREAVHRIRAMEEEHGILSTSGAKIIMTTAVDDMKEVVGCFHELCDAYLTKPVERATLMSQMKSCHLIQ